jgi:hypothetical protein
MTDLACRGPGFGFVVPLPLTMKTPPQAKSILQSLAIGLLIGSSSLLAQTWDGGASVGSSWNQQNNWDTNTVPDTGANISFTNVNNGKTNLSTGAEFSLSSITFAAGAPTYTNSTGAIRTLTLTGLGIRGGRDELRQCREHYQFGVGLHRVQRLLLGLSGDDHQYRNQHPRREYRGSDDFPG